MSEFKIYKLKVNDLVLVIDKNFKTDFGRIGKIIGIYRFGYDGRNVCVEFNNKDDYNYFSKCHLIVI